MTDAQVTTQVATALLEDPYFYAEHVTVTRRNGVVHLQGSVHDDWDLRIAIRISRKAAGGARIVNELEMNMGGTD